MTQAPDVKNFSCNKNFLPLASGKKGTHFDLQGYFFPETPQ